MEEAEEELEEEGLAGREEGIITEEESVLEGPGYEETEYVYTEEFPEVPSNVRYIYGDLSEEGDWRSELKGIDVVVSLTKPFSEQEDMTDEEIKEYSDEHTKEITNLLKAASGNGVKLAVITFHTLCLEGKGDEAITGVDNIKPVGYCKPMGKALTEVGKAAKDMGVELINVFPSMVYGDGSWFSDIIDKFEIDNVYLVEPGDNWLSVLHIDDLAAMYCDIVEKVHKGDTFILSDTTHVTQKDFINYLADLLDVPRPQMISFKEYEGRFGRLEAETFSASIKVSPEKALRKLDHQLKFPTYEEGIPDILDDMGIEYRRERRKKAA